MLIAAVAFAVEMAVGARYGYDRDELYFLAAGRHLAFGYVDQPPLTPLLARISAAATGNTLIGFRVLPALALAALVVATATMSRLLGAGRTGQLLAALAAATCAEYLGAMHELTTTTPDFVFWAITLLLVLRLLESQDPRWWVAIGGCVGIASEAKWNIGFLAAALGAGFLATDARRLLRSRYLLIGGAIAAVLAAPDLIWQAAHGWPSAEQPPHSAGIHHHVVAELYIPCCQDIVELRIRLRINHQQHIAARIEILRNHFGFLKKERLLRPCDDEDIAIRGHAAFRDQVDALGLIAFFLQGIIHP